MSKITDFNFQAAAAVAMTQNTETIVITSIRVVSDHDPCHVNIWGTIQLTPPAAMTAVTLKLYAGTTITAGNKIWTGDALTVIASKPIAIPYAFQQDFSGLGNLQITLTATDTAAGAGWNVDFANICVSVS